MRFPLLSRLAALALLFTVTSGTAVPQPPGAGTPPLVDKNKLKEDKDKSVEVKKPELDKPDGYKAAVGQPIVVVVKYTTEELGQSDITSDNVLFEELGPSKKGEKRFLFWASAPGTYYVDFWTTVGVKASVKAKIVVTGKAIIDPIGPGPGTGPVKTVLFVTDSTSPPLLVGQIAALFTRLGPTLKGMQITLGAVDKENVGADGKPGTYAKLIETARQNGGFPHYFFLDADKNVLDHGMLSGTTTADSLVEKIKQYK